MSEDLNMLIEDVADIDGNVIAAAGSAVGKNLLSSVAGKGDAGTSRTNLADTPMLGDVQSVFDDIHLGLLFPGDLREKVVNVASRASFPEAVFREMEKMRSDNPILYSHSIATATVTIRLIMEIVVKVEDLVKIFQATLLKDIGMMRVPTPVTRNNDYLTKQQYFHIRKHPVLGLLVNTYYLGEGIEGMVALRHHMRNGAGYPQWGGLKPSRLIDIIEVVDIFYALISPRPFRHDPFDIRGATDELTEMAHNGEISEDALKLLIACMRDDKPDLSHVHLSTERQGFVPESNFFGTGPGDA